MSLKGRIKFVVAGTHPLLQLVRDRLIQTGYALVPWSEHPDFCLFGGCLEAGADLAVELPALTQQAQAICGADIPTLLLSRPLEGWPPPTSELSSVGIYSSTAEYLFTQRTRTLILRTFDVYGPDIHRGVVHKFILAARREEALTVYGAGYEVRTFLYQEDFLTCVDKCTRKFMASECHGIYDVGHPDEHSIKRLADSVWQLTHGRDVVTLVNRVKKRGHGITIFPETHRTEEFAGWIPKTSLRQGLWLMIEG